MKELTRHQCIQIAGGDPGMVLAGGGGFGSGGSGFGGSSFGSGGIDFGSSISSGFDSVWEGSGGFESSAAAGVWSLDAIGIEGGPMAVVTIGGTPSGVPVFDIEPSIALYGPGEAPWEGQYLGQWIAPAPPSYEHSALDGAIIANAGRVVGAVSAGFIEGVLSGAGYGSVAGPVGSVVGGIAIGFGAAYLTYHLLQRDHDTGHFADIP